jgi:ubiquinone biosynthesis protein COQ4
MTLRVDAKMKRLKTVWLRNQIKPLAAWRAMRELLKNPDDTTQVFHIIEALKGDSLGAAVRRLRSSDRGRALACRKSPTSSASSMIESGS